MYATLITAISHRMHHLHSLLRQYRYRIGLLDKDDLKPADYGPGCDPICALQLTCDHPLEARTLYTTATSIVHDCTICRVVTVGYHKPPEYITVRSVADDQ